MGEIGSELLNVRVVAVDDESDTLEVTRIILESHGANAVGATSAAEGLALVTRFRPDVLLSDIAMPEEDGYTFIRKVRALPPDQGGDTPAIALSAHVYEEDRERAFAAGYQAFLAKPLNPRALLDCIRHLLRGVRRHIERRRAERRRDRLPWSATFERRSVERRLVNC